MSDVLRKLNTIKVDYENNDFLGRVNQKQQNHTLTALHNNYQLFSIYPAA